MTLTVNQHGQITLPASIRSKAGISKGTMLEVTERGSVLELRKIVGVDAESLKALDALASSKSVSKESLVSALKEISKTQ